MGLIQEGDFTISYEDKTAIVRHIPTKKIYIRNTEKDRAENLKKALDAMEQDIKNIIKEKDFKIICPKCSHVFNANDDDNLWCYETDEPRRKDIEITIQCPNCDFEKEY